MLGAQIGLITLIHENMENLMTHSLQLISVTACRAWVLRRQNVVWNQDDIIEEFLVPTAGPQKQVRIRAVDPHSFYADPGPAVFLNADPDPGSA